MPFPAGLKSILFASALLTASPGCLAEDPEYQSGRLYLVETGDGGSFTSEIADSDGDSLYFVDGSAMARSEVAQVRRPGEWAEGRTLHPGPETEPKGSTLSAGNSPIVAMLEFLSEVLIALFH